MKVKLLCSRGGIHPNGVEFSQSPGQEIDVDRATGQRMVDAAQASFVSLSAEEIAEDKAAEEKAAEEAKKGAKSKAAEGK